MTMKFKQRRLAYEYSRTDDIVKSADAADVPIEEATALIRDPEFIKLVDADRDALLLTEMETAERIIARYANIANNDPGDFFLGGCAGYEPKPVELLTKAQRQCIKKITHSQHGTTIEFHCPMRANDKLAEFRKLFIATESNETTEEKASRIRELLAGIDSATTGITAH